MNAITIEESIKLAIRCVLDAHFQEFGRQLKRDFEIMDRLRDRRGRLYRKRRLFKKKLKQALAVEGR